jgi:hypothetical protein
MDTVTRAPINIEQRLHLRPQTDSQTPICVQLLMRRPCRDLQPDVMSREVSYSSRQHTATTTTISWKHTAVRWTGALVVPRWGLAPHPAGLPDAMGCLKDFRFLCCRPDPDQCLHGQLQLFSSCDERATSKHAPISMLKGQGLAMRWTSGTLLCERNRRVGARARDLEKLMSSIVFADLRDRLTPASNRRSKKAPDSRNRYW